MKDKFLHFLEKGIALLGLCLFFLYFSGVVSFAASKPINSIHIQIYSKLESVPEKFSSKRGKFKSMR